MRMNEVRCAFGELQGYKKLHLLVGLILWCEGIIFISWCVPSYVFSHKRPQDVWFKAWCWQEPTPSTKTERIEVWWPLSKMSWTIQSSQNFTWTLLTGCQMDGSRGAIKQPLRVQTPPLGRCWYRIIMNHELSLAPLSSKLFYLLCSLLALHGVQVFRMRQSQLFCIDDDRHGWHAGGTAGEPLWQVPWLRLGSKESSKAFKSSFTFSNEQGIKILLNKTYVCISSSWYYL